jgi:hypothetical protein
MYPYGKSWAFDFFSRYFFRVQLRHLLRASLVLSTWCHYGPPMTKFDRALPSASVDIGIAFLCRTTYKEVAQYPSLPYASVVIGIHTHIYIYIFSSCALTKSVV